MTVLSAFYDLKVSPATFDIFEFLYQAEIERIHNGNDALDIFIVGNDANDGFREENTVTKSSGDLNWRLRNIVLPAGTLLPSVRRTVHVNDRDEIVNSIPKLDQIFPRDYTPKSPIASYLPSEMLVALYSGKKLGTFRAPPAAVKAAQDWIDSHANGLKPIVITIRHSSSHSWRNSNESEWKRFIDWLDKDRFFPIVIKDTETIFDNAGSIFDVYPTFDIGALNLQLRLAMYECAYLNMMLSSGPGTLCFLDDKTRAVRFKMLAPNDQTSNYASRGFEWGMQWPNSTPYQKSIWEEDRFEVIVREFEAMIAVIEGKAPAEERPIPDILQTISLFIAGENFASANALLEPLLKKDPANLELAFLFAKTKLGLSDFESASLLFQKLDLQIENNPEILAGWGKCLLEKKEFDNAVSILESARAAGSQDPFVLLDLVDGYIELSRSDAAITSLIYIAEMLGKTDESLASWETGRRLISLYMQSEAFIEARQMVQNMRERFGHYTEISATLDDLQKQLD